MTIGEKIYQCRKRQNLTQEALAERLSVSRQSVSKWETGDALPEITKLKPLSEIFGVSVEWLLSDNVEAETKSETGAYKEDKRSSERTEPKKYAWLLGLALSIFGFVRFLMSIPSLAAIFFSFNRGFPADFALLPLIINILINVVLIIVGAVLAKKLKQRNE